MSLGERTSEWMPEEGIMEGQQRFELDSRKDNRDSGMRP